MSHDLDHLARAFKLHGARSSLICVKPRGFILLNHAYETIRAGVTSFRLVRKRFERGKLACHSTDGFTGSKGKHCDLCDQHGCSPRIVLELDLRPGPDQEHVRGPARIELNFSSSRNFLRFALDQVAQEADLADLDFVMSVKARESWGEVCFDLDGAAGAVLRP